MSFDQNIPHGGKKIYYLAVSPNGTYVVTYSKDDKSIVGWIIDKSDIETAAIGVEEDPDPEVDPLNVEEDVCDIKVSDNKVVFCQHNQANISIYKLKRTNHIKIKFKYKGGAIYFIQNEEFVYCQPNSEILVYSLRTINNDEFKLNSIYKLIIGDSPIEYGIVENKIWVRSSHYLYSWDLNTLQKSSHYLCSLVRKHIIITKVTFIFRMI